ncbi:glutathione-s-transferase [Zopfochytrium polystomum]|nr:glutathione-s-transferase [Zopfochytrium polystomum]
MAANLYCTQTSCGAASYIAAHKAGVIGTKVIPNETDIRAHKVLKGAKAGTDFYAINPKGNVPTLVLADGTLLNENAAVLQWIADAHPPSGLAPAPGSSDRYLLQSKLNWLSSELHTCVGALINPTLAPEIKQFFTARAGIKLKYLNDVELAGGKKFLVGDKFTVADSYCYIILSWAGNRGLDLSAYPAAQVYFNHIKGLDFVEAAHAAMAAEK